MSERRPLADYLRARRAALRPEHIGLPDVGTRRRVPGLRREEVADRARISRDYYLRVEQGHDITPSDQVLSALAHALNLNDFERAYLFRVARPRPKPIDPASHAASPQVISLLNHWPMTPAFAFDANLDVLAANDLVYRIAPDQAKPGENMLLSALQGQVRAVARDESPDVLQGWDYALREMVAALRFYSDPDDPRLQEIVGAASVAHKRFRTLWAMYETRPFTHGAMRVEIEPFGWIDFDWQTLELSMTPGQYVMTYLSEPGSRAEAVIDSLSPTRQQTAEPVAADRRAQALTEG